MKEKPLSEKIELTKETLVRDVKEAVERAEKRLKNYYVGSRTNEIIEKIWKEEFGRFK